MKQSSRDPRVIGAWIVGLASFGTYFLTIAPTVAFWDTGEFISAAYTLGITHPPAAPTFALLGRLFTLVPTPFNVAAEVNFISVLTSAVTALLLYALILEIVRLWGGQGSTSEKGTLQSVRENEREVYSPLVQAIAAGTGALAYAFSSSAWFNAVEAEVYSLSMMVTALCLWLVFRHLRGGTESRRAPLLLLIGYVFGVGAANHLLALLTIPSILILLWYFDRPVLKRTDIWLWVVLLAGLGYTIYAIIFIRSGLNPPIDITDPENWQNFMQVLQRRQYGSESMVLAIFDRKADFWSYQLDYHFLRYFRREFFLPFYFIAFFGAVVNFQRDRRTFLANAALWTIMGLGLVIYLNMPDPQPRDRDYIFVGCYFATAIWIGTGMAGLAALVRDFLGGRNRGESAVGSEPGEGAPAGLVSGASSQAGAVRTAALVILVIGVAFVGFQFGSNYHSHDRSGDWIAWDYGYNILQSCEQDAIIFTNGDNDTYPLWYLQTVEGIRPDVAVINLSILNLEWYIKWLRDVLGVPMRLTDQQISRMGLAAVPQDTTLAVAGLEWRVPGQRYIRIQDQMVVQIIAANEWKRPVYFAITVPVDNMAFLDHHAEIQGFALQVKPEALTIDPDLTEERLRTVFRYEGITDDRIYKDENASTLIHNYRVVFQNAANALLRRGEIERSVELLEFGDEMVDFSGADFQAFRAYITRTSGDTLRAQEMLEEILDEEFQDMGSMIRAYVTLTYSYAATGQFDRAASVLERWLAIAPGDAEARAWLDTLRTGRIPAGLTDLIDVLLPQPRSVSGPVGGTP